MINILKEKNILKRMMIFILLYIISSFVWLVFYMYVGGLSFSWEHKLYADFIVSKISCEVSILLRNYLTYVILSDTKLIENIEQNKSLILYFLGFDIILNILFFSYLLLMFSDDWSLWLFLVTFSFSIVTSITFSIYTLLFFRKVREYCNKLWYKVFTPTTIKALTIFIYFVVVTYIILDKFPHMLIYDFQRGVDNLLKLTIYSTIIEVCFSYYLLFYFKIYKKINLKNVLANIAIGIIEFIIFHNIFYKIMTTMEYRLIPFVS